MIIGIPKERKVHEYRVSVTPQTVRVLTQKGYRVLIERGAGAGSAISDGDFSEAGAEIVETNEEVFKKSDLIVKVKEPTLEEISLFREGQILFSYLHIAANPALGKSLADKGVRAIAYETVEMPDGSIPLLIPMSRIAGRLSVQIGIHFLEKLHGGKGVLIGSVPGVKPGKVTIIGGGTVGYNATLVALGLKAEVTVIDKGIEKLELFHKTFEGRIRTLPSYPEVIKEEVSHSDIVVGAVLVPGARTPRVITKDMISSMEPGSVLVDVAIDQGGCAETSRPTTHESPTFTVDGVIHYCVTNIPSLVSRTATYSLSNASLSYILKIAEGRLEADKALRKGINVDRGKVLINV